jgi:hypothetical protein|tara:strand:+ start:148 stop:327 length:180 start_codon:yes stop_codon:yes gene_type:complete
MLMKVKEIIHRLQQCNQELECYGFFKDDIRNIIMIDNSIEDRVDFNLEELDPDYVNRND